ncbi:MAG: tyrosine-protein phosphatase [Ekhidna sp.]
MRFFKKKSFNNLLIDIHSHLIPGIDDGAKSLEQTLEMLTAFKRLGYQKIITTPHIHPRYPNTIIGIKSGLEVVQKAINEHNLDIQVEVAAEYFVDEEFLNQVKTNKEILFFGKNLVLVESSFLNKPIFFEEALFELKSKGYTPVLAHPERYQFLEGSIEWLQELKSMGTLMQVTASSICGYYGESPQKIAKKLFKNNLVDILGSDLHKISQVAFLEKAFKKKEIQSYLKSGLCLNNSFL